MEAFSASGQPVQALRVYRAYARRRREELGEEPAQALQALARRLGRSEGPKSVADTAGQALEAAGAFALTPAGSSPTEPPETERERSVPGSASARRLVGGEFLLRMTTRFFGREEETVRLSKMLSAPRTRLVTLLGPGGAGKTRLALEVAAHLVENAGDPSQRDTPTSAVFVSLTDVAEAERLFDRILRSLGSLPAADRNPLDQLAQALLSQPNTLLVLDNFEQMAEEGALQVRALLAKVPHARLLVTSRQKLQIEGEWEFHLAPLPTSSGAQTPQDLLSVPSIALFVDRAQAVLPDFQLTDRNAAAVAQLCDYLEGLPLAIELAAARVSVLSPARILEQVSADRLGFLAARRRDAALRQQTLRATLDWSYRLLPEAGQQMLAALSVFRGGWTVAAAQAVWQKSEEETLELLTLLRDSSLITVTDSEEALRFTMLETIREYSREKLEASGKWNVCAQRHRDYFLALAEEAEAHLTGSDQAWWLERLEAKQDNLRAALEWCETEERGAEAGLRLTGALGRFWELHGDLREGYAALRKALGREGAAERTGARAKALHRAGILAHSLSDYRAARAVHEESLEIYRELGDRSGIATALDGLGNLAMDKSDFAVASQFIEESLAIRQELGDRAEIALSLFHLGNMAREQGDNGTARMRYEESLALWRELGDRQGRWLAYHNLGVVAEQEGDFERARSIYEECLPIWREMHLRSHAAWALLGLGYIACRLGDFPVSHSLLTESLLLFRKLEYAFGMVRSLLRLGELALAQGQMERAGRLFAAVAGLEPATGALKEMAARQEFHRSVAAVRAALGKATFAAVWKQGRVVTLEQAIAWASSC
jgi:predicted ATPase